MGPLDFFSNCGGQHTGRRQARLQAKQRLGGREAEESQDWVEGVASVKKTLRVTSRKWNWVITFSLSTEMTH